MKGYVAVPPALLADGEALAVWFAKSVAFAGTLKAKPLKKSN